MLLAGSDSVAHDRSGSQEIDDPQAGRNIPKAPAWHVGPTEKYPFLPSHLHSCRPGGPRLYDMLLQLPKEPYGVLWWQVLETEQELLEVDDVPDEDKVMMALWNRWIFLNK